MKPNKKQLIAMRRQKVRELVADEWTQEQIAYELKCSQATISTDIAFLINDAADAAKSEAEELAYEHRKVKDSMKKLKKQVKDHINTTQHEMVKVTLYDVLLRIEREILNVNAIGDMISRELIERSKAAAEETREDVNKTLETSVRSDRSVRAAR